jgi:hypothetical protein
MPCKNLKPWQDSDLEEDMEEENECLAEEVLEDLESIVEDLLFVVEELLEEERLKDRFLKCMETLLSLSKRS